MLLQGRILYQYTPFQPAIFVLKILWSDYPQYLLNNFLFCFPLNYVSLPVHHTFLVLSVCGVIGIL